MSLSRLPVSAPPEMFLATPYPRALMTRCAITVFMATYACAFVSNDHSVPQTFVYPQGVLMTSLRLRNLTSSLLKNGEEEEMDDVSKGCKREANYTVVFSPRLQGRCINSRHSGIYGVPD